MWRAFLTVCYASGIRRTKCLTLVRNIKKDQLRFILSCNSVGIEFISEGLRMPRRKNRFSQLERELKATGYAPAPDTRAFQYLQFKKGINTIDMKNVPTSAERVRKGVALLPFNMTVPATPTPANRYICPITVLSNTGRTTFNLSDADLGYEALASANRRVDNFYPAVLRAFNKSANAPTSPTSGILKKEYKRYGGRSYSIPFGRSGTLLGGGFTVQNATEEESRNELVEQIKVVNPRATVSYEPELFTSPKADLASLL